MANQTISLNVPTNPAAGDLWYNTVTGSFHVWTGRAWNVVTALPPGMSVPVGAILTPTSPREIMEHHRLRDETRYKTVWRNIGIFVVSFVGVRAFFELIGYLVA